MLAESHPLIRRIIRFFLLPYCFSQIDWKECSVNKLQVVRDYLYVFFRLKFYPDIYNKCRLWEKDREQWGSYYGSSYDPYQRAKLRREVQPYSYQILFRDKEVCDLLCRGAGLPLPALLGVIDPSSDYRAKLKQIFKQRNIKSCILKPVLGNAGMGIVFASQDGTEDVVILAGERRLDLEKFHILERYLVQDLVEQHGAISQVASNSVNTIRILTLLTLSQQVKIISATMRFGSGGAVVDNWSAGGVAVGVDCGSGRLRKYAFNKWGKKFKLHPVSLTEFDRFEIPFWKEAKELAIQTQGTFPFYKLLGLDVAISVDGPVLIEINGSADLVFQEQTSGPLLTDEYTWQVFKEYDLFVNRHQKKLFKIRV